MKKRNLEKRNQADLLAVLRTPQGRRLLWRVLQAAQIHEHGFVPGDAYATAFHCGQKSVGLFLFGLINQTSPLAFAQMQGEYQSEVQSEQNEINQEAEEMHDA